LNFPADLFLPSEAIQIAAAARSSLLLPAQATEAAAGAAKTAAEECEEKKTSNCAKANPNPNHVLTVRIEGVLPVTVLYRFQAVTVHYTHSSFLQIIQRVIISAQHIVEGIFYIINCVSLY
jgi:hypothetical protein